MACPILSNKWILILIMRCFNCGYFAEFEPPKPKVARSNRARRIEIKRIIPILNLIVGCSVSNIVQWGLVKG